jgi:hypothetical protein
MAITKAREKPVREAFAGRAPDPNRKGVMRGSKEQITLLLPPETLQRVEQRARRKGIARAALLSMVIHEAMDAMDAADVRGSRP